MTDLPPTWSTAPRDAAKPGTADYVVMDTNGDGVVDNLDDPYAPYYPGDTSVDWVGMSVGHPSVPSSHM